MRALRSVGRGIRLRCPACGRAPVFRTFFEAHETCPACGRAHASDRGDWTGGAELTLLLCLPVLVVALVWLEGMDLPAPVVLGTLLAGGAVLVPLVYRRVKGFWLGVVCAWEGDDPKPRRSRDPQWFSDLWDEERDAAQIESWDVRVRLR